MASKTLHNPASAFSASSTLGPFTGLCQLPHPTLHAFIVSLIQNVPGDKTLGAGSVRGGGTRCNVIQYLLVLGPPRAPHSLDRSRTRIRTNSPDILVSNAKQQLQTQEGVKAPSALSCFLKGTSLMA